MLPARPPYTLASPAFPFRALAELAGRAPVGGERETVLGCFVGARLAVSVIGPPPLGAEARAARAAAARAWYAALTLPAVTRIPFARLVDATAAGGADDVAAALDVVASVAAPMLDGGARGELEQLAAALRGPPPGPPPAVAPGPLPGA